MLNIGKRKWASSFCLASSFGGAIFSSPSNTVAADDEFLKSSLFDFLVGTVFKCRVDHFFKNNLSTKDVNKAIPKGKLNEDSVYVDTIFASTFEKTYKKLDKNKYFDNIFFDKNKNISEECKILSLDNQFCWENTKSLENKIAELKKQGLDTLVYWYAITDFKQTCAKARRAILLKVSPKILVGGKKWLCKEIEKTNKVEENTEELKEAIKEILKGNIDAKILDFLRGKTYEDMFLDSKGEYHQEKFGAYMNYIGKFCERIRNGELDKVLSTDEKKNLLFCESLADTFLKIVSISHSKMPKDKQNNKFQSGSPYPLNSLKDEGREFLIFKILKCSKILIDRKFLTKDYIAKAIEEIAKSFSSEDSKGLFFKVFFNLEHMFREYVAGREDTFDFFNVLIKNLKGENQEELIFEIIKRLKSSAEKKDVYLSRFLFSAIKELSKEQRKNLFKIILSDPSVFKNGDDSKEEWLYSILKVLVYDFSEKEKRDFFFSVLKNADNLLKKEIKMDVEKVNGKWELKERSVYTEADKIWKSLQFLLGEKAADAIVDSFLYFLDTEAQKAIWGPGGDPLVQFSAPCDTIIKFFSNNVRVFRENLKDDVSDFVLLLVEKSSGIRFEKND